jgi:hypothetical protein
MFREIFSQHLIVFAFLQIYFRKNRNLEPN